MRSERTLATVARRSLSGIAAAALLVISSAARELSAQESCPNPPRIAQGFGSQAVIDARSAVLLDDGVVLFGKQAATVSVADGVTLVDSIIAGLRTVQQEGRAPRVIPVPLPKPDLRVRGAKAIRVGPHEARVFFRGLGPGEPEDSDSFALWTARLVDGAWKGLTKVGDFADSWNISTEITGEVVTFRGRQAFVFAQSDSGNARSLVTVWVEGDSISVDRQPVPFVAIGYTSLVEHDGQLFLALTAESNPPSRQDGRLRPIGPWLAQLGEAGWADFRAMPHDGFTEVFEPKLLSTPHGLVFAYNAGPDQRITFRWRSAQDTTAPEHTLNGRWPVSRPAGDYKALVALPDTAPVARILELSPHGYRVVATVQNLLVVPVIAGWGDRLLVSSIVRQPGSESAEVALYDLSCRVRGAHE